MINIKKYFLTSKKINKQNRDQQQINPRCSLKVLSCVTSFHLISNKAVCQNAQHKPDNAATQICIMLY